MNDETLEKLQKKIEQLLNVAGAAYALSNSIGEIQGNFPHFDDLRVALKALEEE